MRTEIGSLSTWRVEVLTDIVIIWYVNLVIIIHTEVVRLTNNPFDLKVLFMLLFLN